MLSLPSLSEYSVFNGDFSTVSPSPAKRSNPVDSIQVSLHLLENLKQNTVLRAVGVGDVNPILSISEAQRNQNTQTAHVFSSHFSYNMTSHGQEKSNRCF